jgi:hypothetical protein
MKTSLFLAAVALLAGLAGGATVFPANTKAQSPPPEVTTAHVKQKDDKGKEREQPARSTTKHEPARSSPSPEPPPAPLPIDVDGAGETAIEIAEKSKDPDARWRAIRILGNLRYKRAVPLLLTSLSDRHHYVRSNAARALGDMRVAAAAGPLTKLLKKEKDGGVIEQTSLALANLRHGAALPALKAAAKHKEVQTRMWVLQAVGRLGDKRDVAFLAGYLLDDPSPSVQKSAAQAIEQITRADFGFAKRSGPSGPEAGIERARAWWAKHKGKFKE